MDEFDEHGWLDLAGNAEIAVDSAAGDGLATGHDQRLPTSVRLLPGLGRFARRSRWLG